MKTTKCGLGDLSSKAGCKQTISWDSFPGDWHQAYRCLDCDLVLCRQCMREHFGDHELRRDLSEALASAEAWKARAESEADAAAETLAMLRQECARVAHEKSGDVNVGHEVRRIDLLPFLRGIIGPDEPSKTGGG